MQIFLCLYSRDTFFKHYQQFFSIRLLNSSLINEEAERFMIVKLKIKTRCTEVYKLESMVNDIKISEEFL